jgi:hypothetical protein
MLPTSVHHFFQTEKLPTSEKVQTVMTYLMKTLLPLRSTLSTGNFSMFSNWFVCRKKSFFKVGEIKVPMTENRLLPLLKVIRKTNGSEEV